MAARTGEGYQTPIPSIEIEQRNAVGPGPVIEYKLSPEELEELRARTTSPKKIPSFKVTITKEEYLEKRASGETRNDIKLMHFGNNGVSMKGFLSAWGLLDPEVERKEIEKLRPADPGLLNPAPARAERNGRALSKYPHVTKELVEAEFAKGKSAMQIEREQGMSKNSIFYYLKQWGLRSPHKPVNKTQKQVTVPASVETVAKESIAAKVEQNLEKACITLQVPIISGDFHPISQRLKVHEELGELTEEIESATMNRERAASELFDLIQAYVGLIRSDLADLMPGQDVSEYVQRFIAHHNQLHSEKIDRYAAERGWKVG